MPTVNLQPGQSGAQVTQLQQWLISQGYSIPDGATGYYGPETTAAVKALQQKLGVDNSSGPGYFGPKTIAAAQSQSSGGYSVPSAQAAANPFPEMSGGYSTPPAAAVANPFPTSTIPTTSPARVVSAPTTTSVAASKTSSAGSASGGASADPASTQPAGIPYDPSWAKYGVTADAWGQMNATQQAMITAILHAATNLYSSTGNKVTLEQALQTAASDPNIIAPFADVAKLDAQAFAQGLTQLQSAINVTSQGQQQQFEADRLALADKYAAAGAAYSGYRGLAEKNLAATEEGIVTSSRSQTQATLDQATKDFEAKYGTVATTAAKLQFTDPFAASNVSISGQEQVPNAAPTTLAGTLAGGITGSQPIEKQKAINADASNLVNLSATPNVIPA